MAFPRIPLPQLSIPVFHRYILRQFFVSFFGALLAFVALFIVFDFFERLKVFIQEGSSFLLALTYLLCKIPLIVHLMTPIAVLVATLLAVGRMAQLSEITAMRTSGVSVFWLVSPLLGAGLVISFMMFVAGETVVPWATEYVEQLYHVDIKKKVESGRFSRENFWYRAGNRFVSVARYDSKTAELSNLSLFEFGKSFDLVRRIDAKDVVWQSPRAGWMMRDAVEIVFDSSGRMTIEKYKKVPLVINETPADFYGMQRKPEEMSSAALRRYVEKLKAEGVPVTRYLVDLASKFSFPFVNVVAILLAFPFSLASSRSGKITAGFVMGIAVGFSYHFLHAFATALAGADFLPVIPAAWAANILFSLLGVYLLAAAEG